MSEPTLHSNSGAVGQVSRPLCPTFNHFLCFSRKNRTLARKQATTRHICGETSLRLIHIRRCHTTCQCLAQLGILWLGCTACGARKDSLGGRRRFKYLITYVARHHASLLELGHLSYLQVSLILVEHLFDLVFYSPTYFLFL